jgi:hypothetical protein
MARFYQGFGRPIDMLWHSAMQFYWVTSPFGSNAAGAATCAERAWLAPHHNPVRLRERGNSRLHQRGGDGTIAFIIRIYT